MKCDIDIVDLAISHRENCSQEILKVTVRKY